MWTQIHPEKKGTFQRHIKSVHEGQKFQCPHCEYKATWKGDLQKHIKSIHLGQKFPSQKLQDLKLENLSDDMVREEYFERDVKFEVDSSMKLERSAILKHESLSDNDDGLEECFEKEVKH